MGELLGRNGSSAEWRTMRDEVHRQVCREGWDAARHTFVQSYGSSTLDASALLIPRLGFLPDGDERVRGTIRSEAKAKQVLPTHYGTWPPIAQDPQQWAARVQKETTSKPTVLKPGETLTL